MRCAAASAASHLARSRQSSSVCGRSEEHTSELQSRSDLVCRLLLEKKKKVTINGIFILLPLSPANSASGLQGTAIGMLMLTRASTYMRWFTCMPKNTVITLIESDN